MSKHRQSARHSATTTAPDAASAFAAAHAPHDDERDASETPFVAEEIHVSRVVELPDEPTTQELRERVIAIERESQEASAERLAELRAELLGIARAAAEMLHKCASLGMHRARPASAPAAASSTAIAVTPPAPVLAPVVEEADSIALNSDGEIEPGASVAIVGSIAGRFEPRRLRVEAECRKAFEWDDEGSTVDEGRTSFTLRVVNTSDAPRRFWATLYGQATPIDQPDSA